MIENFIAFCIVAWIALLFIIGIVCLVVVGWGLGEG